ncbi:MAG: Chloride channel protein [Myxococcales bacterium]|nr:Chloride channel protein [Myxococcales bacterium]
MPTFFVAVHAANPRARCDDRRVTAPPGKTPPRGVLLRPVRNILALIVPDEPPLELQIIGRTLLHAALVGFVAGIIGSAFLYLAEQLQSVLLQDLSGYDPLRAAGELHHPTAPDAPLRWYFLLFIPALGGVVCGYLSRFAPETRGGGGDAAIEAFHEHGGQIRPRVLSVKFAASIATLGTGGAGGREGPTMQIGAALGSVVGRYLMLSARERRTLMVAGIAAGISAVFRTPLGAALLAIEVLYRDDFESEALIPAVLASVIAYSVALSVFGTEPLFGTLPHFPFHPRQLPLYLGLALLVSVGAKLFETSMSTARRLFAKLPGPEWIRPAFGGLGLGVFVVVLLFTLDPWIGNGHRGMGVLGGGYGAGQIAISGADWVKPGWTMVELLLILAAAKIVAASLTIGSGGAAGDFAPSIAIGGLLGGAFGLAARLLLDDPSIQPGGFALVGMAAFYAGIANVPLAALVMVSEVAGSYDLLVPLMLTEAVAMIALRRVNLYHSQPRTTKQSPVHANPLMSVMCGDVIGRERKTVLLRQRQTIGEAAGAIDAAPDQDVFPVVDDVERVVGLLSAESLRGFVAHREAHEVSIVADVAVAPLTFNESDDVRTAALALVRRDLRAAPVLDKLGRVVGMIDQHDVMRAMTAATMSPDQSHG